MADTLRRMTAKIDSLNACDPLDGPLAGNEEWEILCVPRKLVFKGVEQRESYTDSVLHHWLRAMTD